MQLHTYSTTHPPWYSLTAAWPLLGYYSSSRVLHWSLTIVWTFEPSLLQEFLCIASMYSSYPVHFKMLAHSWVIQAWVCPMITTLNLVKAMSAEPLVSCHCPVFLASPRSSWYPLILFVYFFKFVQSGIPFSFFSVPKLMTPQYYPTFILNTSRLHLIFIDETYVKYFPAYIIYLSYMQLLTDDWILVDA